MFPTLNDQQMEQLMEGGWSSALVQLLQFLWESKGTPQMPPPQEIRPY